LLDGGKIDHAALTQAAGADTSAPPPQKFAEALVMFIAAYEQYEGTLAPGARCSPEDKLAILMRQSANTAIRAEVPYDQFLDGAAYVYEQQEQELAGE